MLDIIFIVLFVLNLMGKATISWGVIFGFYCASLICRIIVNICKALKDE